MIQNTRFGYLLGLRVEPHSEAHGQTYIAWRGKETDLQSRIDMVVENID